MAGDDATHLFFYYHNTGWRRCDVDLSRGQLVCHADVRTQHDVADFVVRDKTKASHSTQMYASQPLVGSVTGHCLVLIDFTVLF